MVDVLRYPSQLKPSELFLQTSSGPGLDPAQDAYEEAVDLFKREFTKDECKRIWLQDKSSIADVQTAVDAAKIKYQGTGRSKARKWLASFSQRISLYGQFLDVLADNHPEYVALAWGALKFVFVGVLNHEELIYELSKALSEIAAALPRAELYVNLFPSDSMKSLTTVLYATIIKFIQRAAKWYKDGRIKHAFGAIVRPYALRFKDLVDEIGAQVKRVYELALSLSMVELRQTRLEIRDARSVQDSTLSDVRESKAMQLAIRVALEEYHNLEYTGILDTNKRVCEIQFSQIMSFTACSAVGDPDLARLYYASMRNVRRRQKKVDQSMFQKSKELNTWGREPQSSMVVVSGAFQNRHTARDFAADMIDLLVHEQIPVVWALQAQTTESRVPSHTCMDVLKQLTSQVLKLNHTLLNEKSAALNAAGFQSARTEEDWFNLLGAALVGLPQICIVIDTESLGRQTDGQVSWPLAFQRLFAELRARRIPTVVKVLFISYRTQLTMELPENFDKIVRMPRKIPKKTKKIPHRPMGANSRGGGRQGRFAMARVTPSQT